MQQQKRHLSRQRPGCSNNNNKRRSAHATKGQLLSTGHGLAAASLRVEAASLDGFGSNGCTFPHPDACQHIPKVSDRPHLAAAAVAAVCMGRLLPPTAAAAVPAGDTPASAAATASSDTLDQLQAHKADRACSTHTHTYECRMRRHMGYARDAKKIDDRGQNPFSVGTATCIPHAFQTPTYRAESSLQDPLSCISICPSH